jgi:hypothetical protein
MPSTPKAVLRDVFVVQDAGFAAEEEVRQRVLALEKRGGRGLALRRSKPR